MPKEKRVQSEKSERLVHQFGGNIFSSEGEIITCNICKVTLRATKKWQLERHCNSRHHREYIQENPSTWDANSNATFCSDLCAMMIGANIPFKKLDNPHFRDFLRKYTKQHIPSESTLRKNYFPPLYQDVVNKIRKEVGDNKIYVSMDETTDVTGRFVVNVIVGTLIPNSTGKKYLLTCETIEKVNHTTMATVFSNAMDILWPTGVRYNNVLLLVTDAAPYMIKAAKDIKIMYPKLVHLTCLAHGLHRVAEVIRSSYSDVDSFIGNVKKIFRKAPSRIQQFKEIAPGVPLPPNPIITRWGSWLDAAFYYATHYVQIVKVVNSLDSTEAHAIEIAKSLISDDLASSLDFIQKNFCHLPKAITLLQTSDLHMPKAISIVEEVSVKLKESKAGEVTKKVNEKLQNVLEKNHGFSIMCGVRDVLLQKQTEPSRSNSERNISDIDIDIPDIVYYSYAPITSCDIERSFSRYNFCLSERRRTFTFDNLRMYIIVHCNAQTT